MTARIGSHANKKSLDDLLREIGIEVSDEPRNVEVLAVTDDSRQVVPGTLFVAVRGTSIDSHDFIDEAVSAGAVAVVGERPSVSPDLPVPYIHVANSRETLGQLAHAIAGWPARDLCVVGVTGTNGKTSTVQLCSAIFEAAGRPCSVLGTLGYLTGTAIHSAGQTTPGPVQMAELFRESVKSGRDAICLEVSSHALDQHRVAGIDFDTVVFTNLSQDHLDYHSDMDTYFKAKLRLFEMLDQSRQKGIPKRAIVNVDDPRSAEIEAVVHTPTLRYGFDERADIRGTDIEIEPSGVRFTAVTPSGRSTVRMLMTGRHNVKNALAALAVAENAGIPLDVSVPAIAEVVVPGRFERIDCGQPFTVVVDYAHTDDGLLNLFRACREIAGNNRIIAVFGCGGDRDRVKRPKMGRVVGEMADFAILTNDNPRTENPVTIALDAEVGLEQAGCRKGENYLVILDRREAIEEAIGRAQPGDVVAIAGKGHEPYQIVGTERLPFDDRTVAQDVLRKENPR